VKKAAYFHVQARTSRERRKVYERVKIENDARKRGM